ncbi:uncharacterized protein [Epargyreus clarus]|uniref:uncharacterized protein n=1 Tax=Epargyreus clarus TaxID=520877 RepID=UPI003C3011EE
MAHDIKNKVVFITGAATGIGALVVKLLLNEGAKFVAALDVNENAGLSLQEDLNSKYGTNHVKFIKCDVTDEKQLFGAYKTVLDENGSIDVVINNAGIMNDSINVYKKAIEVNVTALVTSTLKALEMMRKDMGGKGGTIINISSIAALHQDTLLPVYFGTKSAVLQFSNCLGLPGYYTRTGVRIITVCFGATDTGLLSTEKLGSFDKENERELKESLRAYKLQSPESAARGVIDAYKQGESGSSWLATHDEPVKDITTTVKKAYDLLSAHVLTDRSSFRFKRMFEVKDKVVLITGGAAGIGASVVRALLDEGIKHITILDISEENGVAFQKELNRKYGNKALFMKCDISQEDQLLNAFETVAKEQGYIDVVINNAGVFNDKVYAKEVDINLTALIRSTFQAWELMRKDAGGRGGTVINVASVAAICTVPVVPVYSATKSAVVKFSNTLGDEIHYSRTGVRIIALCFGVTITSLIDPEAIHSFDKVIEKQIPGVLGNFKSQTVEQAARGLVEVYKQGDSGSVWIVTSGKPAQDITEKYVQSMEIFNDVVL